MLHVQESFLNASEGYRFGDSEIYETYFDDNEPGELFRHCQKEYGRCVSKVYVDSENEPKQVGWVFQRTERYEDTNEPFIREVWVTVFDKPDTVVRTHHYHKFGT